MKNTIKRTLFTLLILASLSFIEGCSNLLSNDANTINGEDRYKISVSIAELGRTIAPSVNTDNFDYTLTGSINGTTTIERFVQKATYSTLTKGFTVSGGTWNFTLEAYSGENLVMQGTYTATIPESTSIQFSLLPVAAGSGKASITVNSSADASVTSTTMTVATTSGKVVDTKTFAVTDTTNVTTTNGVSSFTYTNENLKPGSYIVKLSISYGSGSDVYTYPESLVIYNGITSSKTFAFTKKSFTTVENYLATQETFAKVLAGASVPATNNGELYTFVIAGVVTDFSIFSNALATNGAYNVYLDFAAASTSLTSTTDTFTDKTQLWGLTLPTGVTGVNTYTLSFNSEGGSEVESIGGILYGRTVHSPSNPTRDGYEFSAWKTSNLFTYDYDFDNSKIINDTIIYAYWVKNISITVDGTDGAKLTISDIPEEAAARWIYMNGGQIQYSSINDTESYVFSTTFYFPFVTTGTTYSFKVNYANAAGLLIASGTVKCTPAKGAGEVKITNKDSVAYTVTNHTFHWTTAPVITGNVTGRVAYQLFTPYWGWVGERSDYTVNTLEDFTVDKIYHETFYYILYVIVYNNITYTFPIYDNFTPFCVNNSDTDSRVLFETADTGLKVRLHLGTDLSSYNMNTVILEFTSSSDNYMYKINMHDYVANGGLTTDSEGYYNIILPYIKQNETYNVKCFDGDYKTIFTAEKLAKSTGSSCTQFACSNTSSLDFAINTSTLKMTSTVKPTFTTTIPTTLNMDYSLYSDSSLAATYNQKTYDAYNGSVDLCTDL